MLRRAKLIFSVALAVMAAGGAAFGQGIGTDDKAGTDKAGTDKATEGGGGAEGADAG